MNPHAKEFVPAHILKKRQEEAQSLDKLSEQLNKVELDSDSQAIEKNDSSESKSTNASTTAQQETDGENNHGAAGSHSKARNEISTSTREDKTDNNSKSSDKVSHNSNHVNGDYPEELHDLEEDEDDSFLLNAGENICEFNGEQFIIPGDDDFGEPQAQPQGYDFGNDEDNEDEDVQNAFEEFLGTLPGQ